MRCLDHTTTATSEPTRGSTLHIPIPPTLAFDPGARWTAGLLRVGADAIDAFTLALGLPDSPDLINAHEDFRAYTDRVIEHGMRMWDAHFPGQQIRVAVEVIDRPLARRASIPLHQWVLASRVVTAITGAFPGCVLVPPAKCGHRHLVSNGGTGRLADYYCSSLIGRHPRDWGPIESRDRRRDHEWAAYVIAAEAELLIQARGAA